MSVIGSTFWQYASPQRAYALSARLLPLLFVVALVLTAAGLYVGFFIAPSESRTASVAARHAGLSLAPFVSHTGISRPCLSVPCTIA